MIRTILLSLYLQLCFASWALAQSQLAEGVPNLKEQKPYGAWGLAGLFVILAMIVGLKGSKRTHLD